MQAQGLWQWSYIRSNILSLTLKPVKQLHFCVIYSLKCFINLWQARAEDLSLEWGVGVDLPGRRAGGSQGQSLCGNKQSSWVCSGFCHLVLATAAGSLTAWHNKASTKHWQKSNTWKLTSSFSPEDCESSVTCVNICTCRACTLTVVISMAVHLKVHVRAAAWGPWRLTTIYHCIVYLLYSGCIINIKFFYFPWHCDTAVCFSTYILWVMNSFGLEQMIFRRPVLFCHAVHS